MKINFVGRYYHDITFIPQWITKNALSDWKEVKNFTIDSIEGYSVKSYVVEGRVTYSFENGETHPLKFYCPINHFNAEKAKPWIVVAKDSLGEPAQKASPENITIDELQESEKVKVLPEKLTMDERSGIAKLNTESIARIKNIVADENSVYATGSVYNETFDVPVAKDVVKKRISLGEIEILIEEHNLENGTDLVIVSGSVFEKISADHARFERFLFDEEIKEEKKAEKKGKKSKDKPELEVEEPDFEGENDDQENDEE